MYLTWLIRFNDKMGWDSHMMTKGKPLPRRSERRCVRVNPTEDRKKTERKRKERKEDAGQKAEQFVVRMPDEMRDSIKAVAKTNRRSMNTEIVVATEKKVGRPKPIQKDRLQKYEVLAERISWLSDDANIALDLLFVPACGCDRPGDRLDIGLIKLVGDKAIAELEAEGLLVRGGTPVPVPQLVAELYPENMRHHAHLLKTNKLYPASKSFPVSD